MGSTISQIFCFILALSFLYLTHTAAADSQFIGSLIFAILFSALGVGFGGITNSLQLELRQNKG